MSLSWDCWVTAWSIFALVLFGMSVVTSVLVWDSGNRS